jgi:hypothetical protein
MSKILSAMRLKPFRGLMWREGKKRREIQEKKKRVSFSKFFLMQTSTSKMY